MCSIGFKNVLPVAFPYSCIVIQTITIFFTAIKQKSWIFNIKNHRKCVGIFRTKTPSNNSLSSHKDFRRFSYKWENRGHSLPYYFFFVPKVFRNGFNITFRK